MSNLIDLVPPLNLCKLIPEDEFTDAYAMWVKAWAEKDLEIDGEKVVTITMVIPKQKIIVLPEPPTDEQRDFLKMRFPDAILCKEIYFAPTLQEILAELPPYDKNEQILACCVPDWADFGARVFGESWRVGYTGNCSINDKNPATAALKLWLKMKGIEA